MSLYDDEDLGAPPTEVAVGWSTGAKMMQSQLQVKKPKMGPPKSNLSSSLIPSNKSRLSSTPILAPVIDLKSRKYMEESSKGPVSQRTERVSLYFSSNCGAPENFFFRETGFEKKFKKFICKFQEKFSAKLA